VDFEFMRNRAGNEAATRYDNFYSIVGDRTVPSWKQIREKYSEKDIELARQEYRENQVVKDLDNSKEFEHYFLFNDMDEFVESKADYVQNARNSAISTFAVVKDGTWYEKGEMGWWGLVSNEQDQDDWNRQFSELLDSLTDDTLLSVFDCHI
jgi:hypothetical protein